MEDFILVEPQQLKDFVICAMRSQDVDLADAQTVADVLVAADLRGVDSHGVARLRRYVTGLKTGMMKAHPKWEIERESPSTAMINADAALGQVISKKAMEIAIEKARTVGVGVVSVRNSNHYGIAGYYPMMALQHDMMGCSMTNARSRIVPTFGVRKWFGTNPIAVAIPAGEELPYVLDMATSVVPDGKIEIAARLSKPLPVGWCIDSKGQPNCNAADVLTRMRLEPEGGTLPLGGQGETFGGHKGYGLGLLVDILCGVMSGAAWGPQIKDSGLANLGHFFGAMRVDNFRPLDEFKAEMDKMIRQLRAEPKQPGQERIYIHGEKEFEFARERSAKGIPLHKSVIEDLQKIAAECGIAYDL